jgi:superfamily I DNA/RNA helicase
LNASFALRDGNSLPAIKTSSFETCPVPKFTLGGALIVWRIKDWLRSGASQIAIISPTKPGTSPFVDNLLQWVSSKTSISRKNATTAGPYKVDWENSDDKVFNELLNSLGLSKDINCELNCCELAEVAGRAKAIDVQNWLLKRFKLGGMKTINHAEVCTEIRRIVQQRRAFGYASQKKLFALTVHQAKNREFDSVIVLWPMKLRADPEQNRRLLYNAITRAKRRALVIVEDPKKQRLNLPPFSGM